MKSAVKLLWAQSLGAKNINEKKQKKQRKKVLGCQASLSIVLIIFWRRVDYGSRKKKCCVIVLAVFYCLLG